jgi:nucleoside-diphosphate-sugar epimerase
MSAFLVTGGAGFIGSHIVEALVEKKHFVRVLDNFSSGRKENLSGVAGKIDLIRADIRSKEACLRATRGIDFVLHQAALRSVPKSMRQPQNYNEVNIGGTLNMLEASLQNKVKRFVFASSSSVYGDTKAFPEKESFLPQPVSPYALTKLAGEHYCGIFSRHWGLPCLSLRYFNVFGERQGLDDEYAVVIPKFITCLLNAERPPIYGDGKQSRDFTYVKNIVWANILAVTVKPALAGGVFNIASGKDYTVLDLVKLLNKIMACQGRPVFLKKRPGDVLRTLADLSHSKRFLKFRPKIDFIRGLKLTAEYFKKNA